MKLKNKKTGEIGYLICTMEPSPEKIKVTQCIDGKRGSRVWYYNSLAELNEEWTDVPKEPKDSEYYWYIGYKNDIRRTKYHHVSDFADNQVTETRKEIGNCFESLEEAEKAVEKLKAWKRLKDKGFRFTFWDIRSGSDKDGHYEGEFVMFSECSDDIVNVVVCPNCHTPIKKGDIYCRQCNKLLVRQILGGEE